MAAEVTGVDDAGERLAVGNGLGLNILRLRGKDEAVHRVLVLGGVVAVMPVGGQSDGLAVPFGSDGCAVGGHGTDDAVGIGDEEGAPEAEAGIAVLIVRTTAQFCGGFFDRGRREDRNLTFARDVGGDLEDVHAASGEDGGGEELHLLAIAGGRASELDDRLAADLRDGRLRGLRFGRGLRLVAAAGEGGEDCQSEGRGNESLSNRHGIRLRENRISKRFLKRPHSTPGTAPSRLLQSRCGCDHESRFGWVCAGSAEPACGRV